MYVVTFYSFKGGAGRSMALINIAIEMAMSGNRVLVVDFDLEAPGIETFNLPRPKTETPGLVDYVQSYLTNRKAPDVASYLYKSAVQLSSSGELWIMPAGLQDAHYSVRLNSIDWRSLYAKEDGYFLFEDLKLQWQAYIDPDYVLIDSRTGYTDVGGICTRQLPDAVVCLFFPTEQNLQGLQKVVTRIRNENKSQRDEDIRLLFVNSNVPDLDDEDQILKNRLGSFKDQLEYDDLAATIHHYNNLALLNQTVFTLERPRSRLAGEYRSLLEKIRRLNPEDREGALDLLEHFRKPRQQQIPHRQKRNVGEVEDRLQKIYEIHKDDSEILVRLAEFRRRQGRLEETDVLLGQAIEAGKNSADIHLRHADIAQRLGDTEQAIKSIKFALSREDADFPEVSRAIRWLRDLKPELLDVAGTWTAVEALSDYEITKLCGDSLSWDITTLKFAEKLMTTRMESNDAPSPELISALILNLIGQGRSSSAIELVQTTQRRGGDLEQPVAFNLGMARWAVEGSPPRELFEFVLQQDEEAHKRPRRANYSQCLSIAHWVVDDIEGAKKELAIAKQRIMSQRLPEFSCWRYLVVEPDEFVDDLESISKLLSGDNVTPEYFPLSSKFDRSGNTHD